MIFHLGAADILSDLVGSYVARLRSERWVDESLA